MAELRFTNSSSNPIEVRLRSHVLALQLAIAEDAPRRSEQSIPAEARFLVASIEFGLGRRDQGMRRTTR